MSESKELITMRLMAWDRAKGELNALLHTYWDSSKPGEPFSAYDEANDRIRAFIKDFEDHCT